MTSHLQPIETAPKDGTFILLFGPSGYTSTPLKCQVCHYRRGSWENHAGKSFRCSGDEPTHWMPLPTANED